MRWIGVSNFNVQQLRRAQAIAPVTSLQPRYSLVHREIEDEILPYCLQERIGVIVYSPMASGLLTGAMTRERAAKLPKDDWRKNHPDFTEPTLSRNLALVERLRADCQTPQPISRRSRDRLDAAQPRRHWSHRRRPQCTPGGRSDARRRPSPHG